MLSSLFTPGGQRVFRLGVLGIAFLSSTVLLAPCRPAVAATTAEQTAPARACDSTDPVSLVDRATASTEPCTLAKRHAMLEMGYFQNASSWGGSQLASYPLLHARYGLTNRTEVFVDPAPAIAKNGLNGQGIYTWGRTGAGVQYAVFNRDAHALSASLDYTPLPDETASLSTRERWQGALHYRYAVSDGTSVSASVGDTLFSQTDVHGNGQSSLFARVAVSHKLSPNVTASALFGRDAHIVVDSTPQSKVGIVAQDRLSPNTVGDVELGTAINPTGNSKAHYLGFGYAILH